MQRLNTKLKTFFYFPKEQSICLFYTEPSVLKHKLFKSLSIQVTPKNSFLFRFRKSIIGHFIYSIVFRKKLTIEFLDTTNIKLGYLSAGKKVLFEFDAANNPSFVFKQDKNDDEWKKEAYLGDTLIEEYSKIEYFQKRKSIENTLKMRWNQLVNGSQLHGDFTHLNVLISKEDKLIFIDENQIENSIFFDHFYFYSYFIQCLERCKTIKNTDVEVIKNNLQGLIKKICKLNDPIIFSDNLKRIDVSNARGLFPNQKNRFKLEFINFMLPNG